MINVLYSAILEDCQKCLLFINNKCVKDGQKCKYLTVKTTNSFGLPSVFNQIDKYPCQVRSCPLEGKNESDQ